MDKNLSLEDYKSLSPEGQRMHDVGQAVKWARGQTDETYGGACALVMADEIVRLTAQLAQVKRERDAAIEDMQHIAKAGSSRCDACNWKLADGCTMIRNMMGCRFSWRGLCAANAPDGAESDAPNENNR